jgi:hypothetical protein
MNWLKQVLICTFIFSLSINVEAQHSLLIDIEGAKSILNSIEVQHDIHLKQKLIYKIQDNRIELTLTPDYKDSVIEWILNWHLQGRPPKELEKKGIINRLPQGEIETFDTLKFSFRPDLDCPLKLNTLRDSLLMYRNEVSDLKYTIGTLKDSISSQPKRVCVKEVRNIKQMAKAILIPGGARFYNESKNLGLLVGLLECIPIPLWFYFNNQREKYLRKANELTDNWTFENADYYKREINYNYNNSQDFRKLRDITATVFIASFIFNFVDAVLNVKTYEQCRMNSSQNSHSFRIKPDIFNGETKLCIEKSFSF